MGLHQKVAELIGKWDGADASDRSAKRENLVTELVALMQNESSASAQQEPASAAIQPAPLKRTA